MLQSQPADHTQDQQMHQTTDAVPMEGVIESNQDVVQTDQAPATQDVIKAAFPQARIKSIMKLDKDTGNVTLDGVYAVSVAVERFLELLSKEAAQYCQKGILVNNRKQKSRHVQGCRFGSQ
jgi:Histone-like transcription factor (CBF/NF-Y) and archaeal histone